MLRHMRIISGACASLWATEALRCGTWCALQTLLETAAHSALVLLATLRSHGLVHPRQAW